MDLLICCNALNAIFPFWAELHEPLITTAAMWPPWPYTLVACPQSWIPNRSKIAAALVTYRTALENAKTRNPSGMPEKNEARRVLAGLLRDLGLYIMSVAKGNLVILSGCGYPLTKVRTPRTISNPGIATLVRGNSSGKMEASVKPEKPSPGYVFQITSTDPDLESETVWFSYGSIVNKYVFTGLAPGTKYWVRVAAVGPRGQQVLGPISF